MYMGVMFMSNRESKCKKVGRYRKQHGGEGKGQCHEIQTMKLLDREKDLRQPGRADKPGVS